MNEGRLRQIHFNTIARIRRTFGQEGADGSRKPPATTGRPTVRATNNKNVSVQ